MTFHKFRQQTVLDVDFTVLGTQLFSANQNYTIGGLSWNKFNTANEQNPAALDNTGITFTPLSTSDYNGATRTVPGLHLPFYRFVPGFREDMGVRIWAYNSANNGTASFDNAVMGVDTNSTAYGYVQKRGFGTTGQGSQTYLGANASNISGFVSDLYTMSTSNNVMVLEIPSITGSAWRAFRGSYAGNYWPAMEALTQHNSYTFSATVNTTAVTPQSLGVFLAGQRATSASPFSCKFARLRVDLLF
jgi:hypothetical protein